MEVRSKGQRYGAKVRDAMKELDEQKIKELYVRAEIIRQNGFIQLLTEVLAVRLEPVYIEVQRYWSVTNIH